ncbi:putative aldo/keto reductase [Yersinia ruckeri]|nr:aldo/keto reductase [Yersinia ruckeri]KFE39257.1 oxidoreductase [Yersinia ruckeri]CNB33480.1 putative aldo/keto reductase [Yersinia ruckeri]
MPLLVYAEGHSIYKVVRMHTRSQLAPQGPEFSRMICGYWRLMEWNMTPTQLQGFIQQHLDMGITTADHADIYGGYQCEQAFGQAMRLQPSLRQKMEIVSKCGIATTAKAEHVLGHYNTGRDHIVHSTEQSLINLHTDYLDLLLIHRPDPLMEADEVAEAFIQLHQSGKVKHFGVSNFTPAQFSLLQSRLPFLLVTNQVEISPLHQPAILDGTLDMCQQQRIKPMAWSCLGGGRLFNDPEFQPLRDELQIIAEEIGADNIEQVVYAWVMRLPSSPLPIMGSGKIERVASAWKSVSLTLNRQQWFRIRRAALGYDVP